MRCYHGKKENKNSAKFCGKCGTSYPIRKLSKFRLRITSLTIAITVALSGCATNPQTGELEVAPSVRQGIDSVKKEVSSIYDSPDPCSNNDRNIGVTVGVLAGAYLGHEIGDNKTGTLIGAALGAGAGGLIGHNMDSRRCALSKIAKENNLTLVSTTINYDKLDEKSSGKEGKSTIGLDVAIENDDADGEFVRGTSQLTPRAQKAYGEIADQYLPGKIVSGADNKTQTDALDAARKRKVLIVGHAAEDGDPEDAAKLSEARAKVVAQVFAAHGVPNSDIYFQGAGDALPVASNATEKGRTENRRVQIVDVPNETDLKKYLSLRVPNPQNFAANATANATATTLPSVPAKNNKGHGQEYDFGGQPVTEKEEPVNLGDPINTSMFSFIRSANAAPVAMGSCRNDHPHIATSVRNLATDAVLPPARDAITGLYGEPITGMLKGNYVAILNAYAPKDAGESVPEPKLEVYKNYTGKHGAHPSYVKSVPVVVYRGSDATLYRMFVNGPMECMDIVVPTKLGGDRGTVYYLNNGKPFVAQASFVAHN